MKILNSEQIRALDRKTLDVQNISSIELMERAAGVFFHWMMQSNLGKYNKLCVVVGPGNNGGDGLVVARLAANFFSSIKIVQLNIGSKKSADYNHNYQLLPDSIDINTLNKGDAIELDLSDHLVIDAIFGSGLNRPISGYWANIVKYINDHAECIYSIDIPSGLYADQLNAQGDAIIKAKSTLSFELPKRSFFYEENNRYTGKWEVKSIKLAASVISDMKTNKYWITDKSMKPLLKTRDRHSHKGTYGHAALVVGSEGMAGAAMLSSYACMRSGVGKTTVITPDRCAQIIQSSIPEAMVENAHGRSVLIDIPIDNTYQAYGIGCGIGRNKKTKRALKDFLNDCKSMPVVLDADALNIIAEEKWQNKIPKGAILTPHPGEFKRLIGDYDHTEERLEKQLDFSAKHDVIVICKGGYTTITTPKGDTYYNTNGNPGMATGGSGDVLTGCLTSLLAQGYQPIEVAIIGVFTHGYAGDLTAQNRGFTGLIARDLIDNLPNAYMKLYEMSDNI